MAMGLKEWRKLPLAKRQAMQEAALKRWADPEWERVCNKHLLKPDDKDRNAEWLEVRDWELWRFCE